MTWLRDEVARQQLASWIGEREVTAAEVAGHIQRTAATAHQLLNFMEAEGRLVRAGHGPLTWRRRTDAVHPLAAAMQEWGR